MKKFLIIVFATFTSMLLFGDLQDHIKDNSAAHRPPCSADPSRTVEYSEGTFELKGA